MLEEVYGNQDVSAFLADNLTVTFPTFEVYRPTDEEYGEWYAIFGERGLYIKKRTPEHEAMLKLGINPVLAHWSQFG